MQRARPRSAAATRRGVCHDLGRWTTLPRPLTLLQPRATRCRRSHSASRAGRLFSRCLCSRGSTSVCVYGFRKIGSAAYLGCCQRSNFCCSSHCSTADPGRVASRARRAKAHHVVIAPRGVARCGGAVGDGTPDLRLDDRSEGDSSAGAAARRRRPRLARQQPRVRDALLADGQRWADDAGAAVAPGRLRLHAAAEPRARARPAGGRSFSTTCTSASRTQRRSARPM